MAAIGNQLTSTPYVNDVFSGTGSQTAFTLTFAPATTAAIAVHVAGVYQAPSAYTLSGTTLTFNSAPALGSSNIQVLHLSIGFVAQVPSDGSVTAAKMAANAINTSSIVDGSITAAKIADGTIIATEIAANTITLDKLAYNTSGYHITTDGTRVLWQAQSALAIANTQVTGTMTIAQGGTGATTLAGANIAVTSAASSFTAKQTFTGSTSSLASAFINATESANVSATAATGTINLDITTASVLYYTTSASGNWTLNIRGNSTTNANTIMTTGDSLTVVFLATQGATAYYNSALTIDGNAITPKYQGGTAYTTGNASGVDAYSYTIVKTGNAAFTVFAAQTQFK
jgi:hypothetical protein